MNSLAELLRGTAQPPRAGSAPTTTTRAPLDAARFASIHVALRTIASIHHWAETDDLDDGETPAERLRAMMLGIADTQHDGEITNEKQEVLQAALRSAWDYFASLGAVDEDLDALLNDWDARTADCIRGLVSAITPEDDGAAVAAINAFIFGPSLQAGIKAAVRINRHIASPAPLSAKQQLAIRKAQARSRTAAAIVRNRRRSIDADEVQP